MQKFIIGTNNFGVSKINYEIDRENLNIIDLTIEGDPKLFDKISGDEDGEWNWAIYPPELYMRQVPITMDGKMAQATINEKTLEHADVALYMGEHNDMEGKMTIDQNDIFRFTGLVYISGKKMNLELEVKLNS